MQALLLDERFSQASLDSRLHWLNPPPVWSVDPSRSVLVVQPAAPTDFWQQTHYGFRADNGHFLHLEVSGDFTMTTKVRFFPAHQYDQAGLMVRLDPGCWIKTSVEYEPAGPSNLGAVITNHGFSDWSLQRFPQGVNEIRLRIQREAADFLIDWAPGEGGRWDRLRVAHLGDAAGQPLHCGVYACSPKGEGFRAEFEFLQVARHVAEVSND